MLGKGPHLTRHRRYLDEASLEPFVFRLRTVKDRIDQWCKNNIAVHHHLRQLAPIDKARGHYSLFIWFKRGRYIENTSNLEVELRIRIEQPNQVWNHQLKVLIVRNTPTKVPDDQLILILLDDTFLKVFQRHIRRLDHLIRGSIAVNQYITGGVLL